MAYCPECGAEVAAEAQFCGNCGFDLTETTEGGGQDGGPAEETPSGQNTQPQQGQAGREASSGQGTGRRQPQQGGRAPQGQGRPPQGQGRSPQGQGRPPQGQGPPPEGGHPQGGHGGQPQPGRAQNMVPQETNGVFDFAIGYPKRDGWTPAILSSVMLLLGIFIVPLFIAIGYGFRVARAAALGRPFPPAFEDWGGLLYDGLRFIGVSLLAGLIWALIAGMVIGGLIVAGTEAGAGVAFLFFYFAASWFIAAFQTAFIGANSVPSAITDGRALSLLTSGYYVKAWLLTIVLGIIFNIIFAISIFTIIGPIFVAGYMFLAWGAFWGYIYYRATQKGIVKPPVEDPQPASPAGTRQQQPPR